MVRTARSVRAATSALTRRHIDESICLLGDLIGRPRRQHPIDRSGMVLQAESLAGAMVADGPDRSRLKAATARRAHISQDRFHTGGAVGALVGADHCPVARRRQVGVTPLAVRSQLEHVANLPTSSRLTRHGGDATVGTVHSDRPATEVPDRIPGRRSMSICRRSEGV